jgi:hypothetical protein
VLLALVQTNHALADVIQRVCCFAEYLPGAVADAWQVLTIDTGIVHACSALDMAGVAVLPEHSERSLGVGHPPFDDPAADRALMPDIAPEKAIAEPCDRGCHERGRTQARTLQEACRVAVVT